MASDPRHLEQLSLASSYCLFDNRLRSTGKSSIIWGVLNLIIGASFIARHSKLGAVSLLLGVALIVTGLYQRKVRDPHVVLISAAMLGSLAVWNFAIIALAAMGKAHLAMGGKTLYWAIAQAWGSYSTWATYSTYKTLRQKSHPLIVEQVRGYIDELNKAKPEQTVDLIQFDVNPGFLQSTKRYRLKPFEDLYLAARFRTQFSSLQLEEVSFVPRSAVTIAPEGEKWMSKKMKATVQLGPLTLEKVVITPDMASRISPAALLAPAIV